MRSDTEKGIEKNESKGVETSQYGKQLGISRVQEQSTRGATETQVTNILFWTFILGAVVVQSLSCFPFCDPWTIAGQSPPSMRFPRQEYWSGLLFPSPGDHPDPGVKPTYPALAGKFFTTEPPRNPFQRLGSLVIGLISRQWCKLACPSLIFLLD